MTMLALLQLMSFNNFLMQSYEHELILFCVIFHLSCNKVYTNE